MVTIVLLVSREFFLQRIFANLETLECNAAETNLLVYVDGDWNTFEKARNLTQESKFKERLCIYRRKGLPNVGSIRSRRNRIADIHTEIKEVIVNCDYIFLLEDDTLIPNNALKLLLKDYSENPYAGFVSGVELGRWGYTHIGAWKVDDVYDPKRITSIPNGQGTIEIDAAGFYCCLLKKDNYLKTDMQPFEDILGPDVNFGIKLRQGGFKNYVNYDIKCRHLTKRGDINFQNSVIVQMEFTKTDKWTMKQLEVI